MTANGVTRGQLPVYYDTVLAGWLFVQGAGSYKQWRKRWCMIANGRLIGTTGPDDPHPALSFPLTNIVEVGDANHSSRGAGADVARFGFYFIRETPDRTTTAYRLCAESQHSRSIWVSHLRDLHDGARRRAFAELAASAKAERDRRAAIGRAEVYRRAAIAIGCGVGCAEMSLRSRIVYDEEVDWANLFAVASRTGAAVQFDERIAFFDGEITGRNELHDSADSALAELYDAFVHGRGSILQTEAFCRAVAPLLDAESDGRARVVAAEAAGRAGLVSAEERCAGLLRNLLIDQTCRRSAIETEEANAWRQLVLRDCYGRAAVSNVFSEERRERRIVAVTEARVRRATLDMMPSILAARLEFEGLPINEASRRRTVERQELAARNALSRSFMTPGAFDDGSGQCTVQLGLEVTDELSARHGAVSLPGVLVLASSAAAAQAGIAAGDVVEEMAGVPIPDMSTFRRVVWELHRLWHSARDDGDITPRPVELRVRRGASASVITIHPSFVGASSFSPGQRTAPRRVSGWSPADGHGGRAPSSSPPEYVGGADVSVGGSRRGGGHHMGRHSHNADDVVPVPPDLYDVPDDMIEDAVWAWGLAERRHRSAARDARAS